MCPFKNSGTTFTSRPKPTSSAQMSPSSLVFLALVIAYAAALPFISSKTTSCFDKCAQMQCHANMSSIDLYSCRWGCNITAASVKWEERGSLPGTCNPDALLLSG